MCNRKMCNFMVVRSNILYTKYGKLLVLDMKPQMKPDRLQCSPVLFWLYILMLNAFFSQKDYYMGFLPLMDRTVCEIETERESGGRHAAKGCRLESSPQRLHWGSASVHGVPALSTTLPTPRINVVVFLTTLSYHQEYCYRKNTLKYHDIILQPYCPPLHGKTWKCKVLWYKDHYLIAKGRVNNVVSLMINAATTCTSVHPVSTVWLQ